MVDQKISKEEESSDKSSSVVEPSNTSKSETTYDFASQRVQLYWDALHKKHKEAAASFSPSFPTLLASSQASQKRQLSFEEKACSKKTTTIWDHQP